MGWVSLEVELGGDQDGGGVGHALGGLGQVLERLGNVVGGVGRVLLGVDEELDESSVGVDRVAAVAGLVVVLGVVLLGHVRPSLHVNGDSRPRLRPKVLPTPTLTRL